MSDKEILVFIEQVDSEVQSVAFELLGAGRILAEKLGAILSAVVLGDQIDTVPAILIASGADRVYVADHPELSTYRTLPYRRVLIDLISAMSAPPNIVLFGSTTTGRDLAPRIAAYFETGLTADCTELDIGPYEHTNTQDPTKVGLYADCLYAIRPSFGESLKARILGPWKNPQMATVRPGVMLAANPDSTRTGSVQIVPVQLQALDLQLVVSETIRSLSAQIELAKAEVIVSGGYGLGNAEGFSLLYELAACFKNSAVGSSRKAVDAGWIDHAHQVGQTGKTVRPRLYLACGISGAIQHRVGMDKSATIVAINKDSTAPIFKFAHHAIVGDLYQVVPELTRQLQRQNTLQPEPHALTNSL